MNSPRSLTTLEGHLEQITYFNEETHYTIARLKTHHSENIVTVVGFMPAVSPGEALKINGAWETHPRYGQQFKIQSYAVMLPASVDGIRKYLESGIIKGIGPSMAQRMVNHFGADTLEVIEKNPEKLLEVAGIGTAKAALICNAWKDHHVIRELMGFLQEAGVKTSFCAKIMQAYGRDALDLIRKNPYRLADDIPGAGFYMADAIARKLGAAMDEPARARACLLHILREIVNDGHIFAHEAQLIERCESIFRITPEATRSALDALTASRELVREKLSEDPAEPAIHAVYLKDLHQAETGLANRLKALLAVPTAPLHIDAEQISAEVQKKLAIELSVEQLHVLEEILSHRVAIITGGPGTGKTTLIRSITAIFEALGRRVLLAAPTGRAARRLSDVTRREAKTIHRLLGFTLQDGLFDKNQDNPLDADAVIIDEASMVDTLLMFHLIKAVPPTASLILVGDVFQLPPIGPGNVLSDMIQSARIPVFYLKTIFRQAQESPIVVNAHRVRLGQMPALPDRPEESGELSEFYFIEQPDPDKVVAAIVKLCTRTLPRNFSLDAVSEVQVLTPMHKGVVGTIHLNQILQKALNPNPVAVEALGGAYRLGDKVMHLKNNYQKEVFNGDIGTILAIDKKDSRLSVDYYGRTVQYDFSEMDELTLAYAISVHKSQGSEYPAVIVPIMTQHFALLQRNLLYTAITRGEKLVILIGTQKALAVALKNDKPRKRLSRLASRLMSACHQEQLI